MEESRSVSCLLKYQKKMARVGGKWEWSYEKIKKLNLHEESHAIRILLFRSHSYELFKVCRLMTSICKWHGWDKGWYSLTKMSVYMLDILFWKAKRIFMRQTCRRKFPSCIEIRGSLWIIKIPRSISPVLLYISHLALRRTKPSYILAQNGITEPYASNVWRILRLRHNLVQKL